MGLTADFHDMMPPHPPAEAAPHWCDIENRGFSSWLKQIQHTDLAHLAHLSTLNHLNQASRFAEVYLLKKEDKAIFPFAHRSSFY